MPGNTVRLIALAGVFVAQLWYAAPAAAQSANTPPPDVTVASLVAALDAHDADRAVRQMADSAIVLGVDNASGPQQVEDWINQQIAHGVIIEVGPLHVNGSRVTVVARVSRSDWGPHEGPAVRYLDLEAAVSGGKITVLAARTRSVNQEPSEQIHFVRARTLVAANASSVGPKQASWGALVALIGLGLLTGLYAASGFAQRSSGAASMQKGRLVPALARAVELRNKSRDSS